MCATGRAGRAAGAIAGARPRLRVGGSGSRKRSATTPSRTSPLSDTRTRTQPGSDAAPSTCSALPWLSSASLVRSATTGALRSVSWVAWTRWVGCSAAGAGAVSTRPAAASSASVRLAFASSAWRSSKPLSPPLMRRVIADRSSMSASALRSFFSQKYTADSTA